MEDIMQAVGLLRAGDRQAARERLLRLWDQWADGDGALQRCTIAHFLADTENDARAELEWDLLALEAATAARGPHGREAAEPGLEGFLPSLYLNAGDAYRRLGEHESARRHAELGLGHACRLGDDRYGRTIRGGLERLLKRLDGDP